MFPLLSSMAADFSCWLLVRALRVLWAPLLFPDIISFSMFLHCSSIHSSFAAFSSSSWFISPLFCNSCPASQYPRSGELRTQKLKSHLARTQSLNVLPLKPGLGQYIAIHATLTARDFFLAYFYPSGPFICIFPKPLPIFSFLCKPAE